MEDISTCIRIKMLEQADFRPGSSGLGDNNKKHLSES